MGSATLKAPGQARMRVRRPINDRRTGGWSRRSGARIRRRKEQEILDTIQTSPCPTTEECSSALRLEHSNTDPAWYKYHHHYFNCCDTSTECEMQLSSANETLKYWPSVVHTLTRRSKHNKCSPPSATDCTQLSFPIEALEHYSSVVRKPAHHRCVEDEVICKTIRLKNK